MKCGIVDIGSNTIQLAVYQWEGATFQPLFNQWETVGLAGYVEGGALSPDGIASACRTLERFAALLDNLEIGDMRVFATASLRNITNSAQALSAIQNRLGLDVALLSGETEARLSFRGAMWSGGASSGLLTDIGGGSTELVSYIGGAMTSEVSLPVGVVSLFSKFVDRLFPNPAELSAMEAHMARLLGETHISAAQNVIGVGGTVRAVLGLCNTLSGADLENRMVSSREVDFLYSALVTGDKDALRLLLRGAPDRLHTVLPGLVILRAIQAASGWETLTMSTTGVREGYLLERVMGLK